MMKVTLLLASMAVFTMARSTDLNGKTTFLKKDFLKQLLVKSQQKRLEMKERNQDLGCPKDFQLIGDRCYKIEGGRQTQINAKNTCEDLGAQLVGLETDEEYQAVLKWLSNPKTRNPLAIWVDAVCKGWEKRGECPGGFEWSTGGKLPSDSPMWMQDRPRQWITTPKVAPDGVALWRTKGYKADNRPSVYKTAVALCEVKAEVNDVNGNTVTESSNLGSGSSFFDSSSFDSYMSYPVGSGSNYGSNYRDNYYYYRQELRALLEDVIQENGRGVEEDCVSSCVGHADGNFHSCAGCDMFITCSHGTAHDNQPCGTGLVWNDLIKTCDWTSTTCKITEVVKKPVLPTVQQLTDLYNLQPHPEGGRFAETFRSQVDVEAPMGERIASTAIYFLITPDSVSRIHKLKADEQWHFYLGCSMSIVEFNEEDQTMKKTTLGQDVLNGELVQYTVKAGNWFGSYPNEGCAYSFVGCTVAPGFEFADFEMATQAGMLKMFPQKSPENTHEEIIKLTYGL